MNKSGRVVVAFGEKPAAGADNMAIEFLTADRPPASAVASRALVVFGAPVIVWTLDDCRRVVHRAGAAALLERLRAPRSMASAEAAAEIRRFQAAIGVVVS